MYYPQTAGCGINHTASFVRNTGRNPNSKTFDRFNKGCDAWRDAVDRGAEHTLCSRLWDAHLQDLGVKP